MTSKRPRRDPPEWFEASLLAPQNSRGSIAPVVRPAVSTGDAVAQRERARKLRVALCKPEMLLGDSGNLNPEYFKAALHQEGEGRAWGEDERALLLRGIETLGCGAWGPIQNTLLPAWKNSELRIKAARLLGRQNIKAYNGWKASAAMLDVERERNKAIADRIKAETGQDRWKNNVLVADDDGLVAAAIVASELAQPRAASL
jgi:hypothetical protein